MLASSVAGTCFVTYCNYVTRLFLSGVAGKLNIQKKMLEKSDFFRQVFRLGFITHNERV